MVQRPQESIDADQPADSAVLSLVLKQALGLLPVVDHGKLVGVITLAGIAAHLIDDDGTDREMGLRW